jgi:hypothetical protein
MKPFPAGIIRPSVDRPLLRDRMRLVVTARGQELRHDEFAAGIGFSGHAGG